MIHEARIQLQPIDARGEFSRTALRILIVAILLFTASASARTEEFVFRHDNILGTSMELRVDALSREDAEQAQHVTLDEIDRLNGILSSYDPESILSKFAEFPLYIPIYLPTELLELFVASDWWKSKTNGAFNSLIQESALLWKESARAGTLPDPLAVAKALESSSQSAWEVDPGFESAMRTKDAKINLDAIAKGYIIDRASEAAKNASIGIDNVLLSIGGDIRTNGSIRKSIGIADPANPADNAPPIIVLELMDRSVTTSANYERGYEIQGTHYSHIIDPRTGYPSSSEVQSASVIAINAAQADALSTALMVLSPDEGIALVESLPDTECLLVLKGGDPRRSSGLDNFIKRQHSIEPNDTSWQEGYELLIEIEIDQPEARRYHRPYIAVWIEDANGHVAKTLCLWAELGSSYMKKLSRWIRLENKNWDSIDALSRATRRPGKYTLFWDGTDENGNQLPLGNYALFIEAVREKGTHQLIREEFLLGTETFERTLNGNLEIKSASLHYSRKTQ